MSCAQVPQLPPQISQDQANCLINACLQQVPGQQSSNVPFRQRRWANYYQTPLQLSVTWNRN